MAAADGPLMLAHLVEIHGHVCWQCGADVQPGTQHWWGDTPHQGPPCFIPVALEVDHIRPLWSLTDEERTEHRWWLPFNLQLLCVACHKAKTKHEAGVRALGLRNVAMVDAEQMLLM